MIRIHANFDVLPSGRALGTWAFARQSDQRGRHRRARDAIAQVRAACDFGGIEESISVRVEAPRDDLTARGAGCARGVGVNGNQCRLAIRARCAWRTFGAQRTVRTVSTVSTVSTVGAWSAGNTGNTGNTGANIAGRGDLGEIEVTVPVVVVAAQNGDPSQSAVATRLLITRRDHLRYGGNG